ncbi:PREDICTED: uncharacterized protein LOC106790182 [Polistes canadensis]|uniref:uncharacterized protein LOC106790182 n=1 Tax=Polistes canadensis TaxID=91411 RepID=UPI000718FF73|nr:PREDICTED: uncharacterized protein LOC106790182 [Polistes canadensis]
MEKNNYCDENIDLSDTEDVLDFPMLEDIVEDNIDYNSETPSSDSEIILPKRRRMVVIESESEESQEELVEWRDVTEELGIPDRIYFNVSPKVIGPQITASVVQPIQYFKLFFTNELAKEIIKETNKYAENVLKNKEISHNSIWQTLRAVEDEFWAFIGVIINIDYFVPGQNICVDESVVKFKGKISFITHNPNKPTKWGIRIYVLADSETGYVYIVFFHTMENHSASLPTIIRDQVPTAKGYHMHTDRYYTSIPLAQELRKMKCHLTGTKRENTMILAWRDKRIVTLLSNWHNAGMVATNRFIRGGTNEEIEKPSVAIG